MSPAKFPQPIFAAAPTAASPYTDWSRRASKNTYSSKGSILEITIASPRRAPRSRGRAKQKSSRHHGTGPERAGRFHAIFRDLHSLQHAAGAGRPQRNRGTAAQEFAALAGASRRARQRGMGAAGLWRVYRACFWRTGAAVLRFGTPVALRPETGIAR